LGLATPLGVLGAIFHIFQHSAAKSLLFLTAGSVDKSSHTRDLREMSGIKEKMPVTAGGSLIASMSLSGIPPSGIFFSKLIIIIACIQKGFYFYAFIAVAGSILTMISMSKIQRFAFFGLLKSKFKNIKEAPFSMQFSMVCLAGICIFGGLLLLPQFRPFVGNAAQVLLDGTKYSASVLGVTVK
jgi:formate hydrogenlyase subunit 3/multisubunit Na+/H+ antiporter MnhD subunit